VGVDPEVVEAGFTNGFEGLAGELDVGAERDARVSEGEDSPEEEGRARTGGGFGYS
jgi:hypothetical protein